MNIMQALEDIETSALSFVNADTVGGFTLEKMKQAMQRLANNIAEIRDDLGRRADVWIGPEQLALLQGARGRGHLGYAMVCNSDNEGRVPLYLRPASVDDAMVERALVAARDASDARLPRYSVVRAVLDAALQIRSE